MGTELLSFLKGRKKKQPVSNNGVGLQTVEPEKVPQYDAGLQADGSVVRLVSNRKIKTPYRVSGIY